ncbi:hypothetical protein NM208_g15137 [Fusarium decemcellulare]|uniref:Uncharacterized protein n=1 Tax=Fusarium decemcellulare TaxID=57161 RepID=A0ACC1RDV1_9HYPO|nr:hypothetical protein NM208_g15137 [Fusarium decemcellulare]
MAIATRLAVAINAISYELARWYETESLVISANKTKVVRRAAQALNIGRGKDLNDIAADNKVTYLVKFHCLMLLAKAGADFSKIYAISNKINLLKGLKPR